MNLTLQRTAYTKNGIFGQLTSDDGIKACVTLEHAYEQPDGSFQPKTPAGVFTCVRGQHQLEHMTKPFETFEITNVPGHTNILLHVGNYNNDSEGCVLVGIYVQTDDQGQFVCIKQSHAAFQHLMALQNGIDKFQLTIVD